MLADWLRGRERDDRVIRKAVDELQKAAAIGGTKTLVDANREVYGLLRYGVNVQPSTGEHRVTVKLIDWENPQNNDFSIAEEVTLEGEAGNKRPDLVLYINGITIGVLELKRSTTSVSTGIRQNLTNQDKNFIEWFFATLQLVMAGSESQGLHYGVIKTPEKHWLRWKEADAHPDAGDNFLLRELSQVCDKARLLDLLHNFIVFRWTRQEDLPPQPILRCESRTRTRKTQGRRHHLAHARQWEKSHDGLARKIDPRNQLARTRAHHHRPHRTRRTN